MSNKKEIAKILKTLGEQSIELLKIERLVCLHENVEFIYKVYDWRLRLTLGAAREGAGVAR